MTPQELSQAAEQAYYARDHDRLLYALGRLVALATKPPNLLPLPVRTPPAPPATSIETSDPT